MIYDPASQTFNGPPAPPKSFLEQQYEGCATAIGIMILAPIMLVCRACEKFHVWQDDRAYALQEKVLKLKPFAVLVSEQDYGGDDKYAREDAMVQQHTYQSLLRQRNMEFVRPPSDLREGDLKPKWAILYDRQKDDNRTVCIPLYGFFEGPNSWERAQQAFAFMGEYKTDPQYKAPEIDGHGGNFEVTCWYDYKGTIYVYERGLSDADTAFRKSNWRDNDMLSAMRKVAR